MPAALEDPFYYLNNFHTLLDWIRERYSDLLDAEEQAFIEDFHALPRASQALLVRMVMRKGTLFPASGSGDTGKAPAKGISQALVTSVGHWRGEGLALIERVD